MQESGKRKLIKGKKVLITGYPGVGKTTLIIKLAQALKDKAPIKGFYTEEVREAGQRVGFRLTTFAGQEDWLSHVNIRSPYRVGKYRVNLAGFEHLVVPLLESSQATPTVFIIDEIGKMECFSEKFRKAAINALDAGNVVLGTIAVGGTDFIREIKERKDIKIYEVTVQNRDVLPEYLIGEIERIFKK